jgi:hypothetical protein
MGVLGTGGGGCGDGEGKVKGNQHNDRNLGTELSKLCVLKENDYYYL